MAVVRGAAAYFFCQKLSTFPHKQEKCGKTHPPFFIHREKLEKCRNMQKCNQNKANKCLFLAKCGQEEVVHLKRINNVDKYNPSEN